MKMEEAIQQFCISSHKTLSLAESCTGGALAARLTAIPSASEYFKGSVVAYSNEIKEKVLGVQKRTLIEEGAVSEEVVKEMCLGVLALMNTDYSIAVSGIAGPSGGSVEKPVGTVWAAIGDSSGFLYAWTFQAGTTREMVINFAIDEILDVFWQKICK